MWGISIGFAIGGVIGLVFMRKHGISGPVVCFIIAAIAGYLALFG